MADLSERVVAELEQIERILEQFPSPESLPDLSVLELAGVGSLLHAFYNGIENILKQVVKAKKISLPSGDSWHKDLILMATDEDIISPATASEIRKYLAFRHFFAHAYAYNLEPQRLKPLVVGIATVFSQFREDISRSAGLAP